MKHFDFRLWLLALALACLAGARVAQAQIEPAAQYTTLTPAQLMAWTSTGPTAVPANVSTVPLAARQNTLTTQLNPNQSFSSKVNWCPDGMNNFVGYLNEQPQFNLYNFTHWQYLDVLTWFASPVGIPCRPWVEAAHRNGVKVIGTVFTDRAGIVTLCQKDAGGNYIGAQKLLAVAAYYGFDGWFFNAESPMLATEVTELRNLLKQLQATKPAGLEIHWYDALLTTGRVTYQNTFNANNAPFVQDGTTRVSDAIFTNYVWAGAGTFNTATVTAGSLGRSAYDVYTGADIWPGRNPQQLFPFYTFTNGALNSGWMDAYYANGNLAEPLTSLAVFAPNVTYNGGLSNFPNNPADYPRFYNAERRLFAGDDLDITTADATGAWKGFGYYQPVRCVITALPFETNFCVGQGKIFANNGVVASKGWTDMAKQALLPSWQWARSGATTVAADFDFARAWYGGTSLKLTGSLAAGASTTVKLYQTKLPLTAASKVDVAYKARAAGASNTRLALYFSDNLTAPVYLDLPAVADTAWTTQTLNLSAYASRELAVVGVQAASATAVATYRVNLGKLNFYNGAAPAVVAPQASFAATATTVLTGQPVTFANSSTNATSFAWTLPGASPATSTDVHPTVSYAAAGTYAVTLQATGPGGQNALTRTGYITVLTAPPAGANTSLNFDGTTKYLEAGVINLSGNEFSLECWVKPTSFKTTSPFISSLLGMEDGGANTCLLRLGDGGLDANAVQFVVQLGNSTQKLASNARLTAGQWTHIAATYDGAAMRLYINGALDNTLAASGSAVANAPFSLARNYALSRCLDGRLDEARAWTRALTAAEIAAHTCGVAVNTPGLEGYWKMNESPAQAASDATGHGHTGVFTNVATSDWSTDVPTQCGALPTRSALPGNGLGLRPLENPVPGSAAQVVLEGAAGQPVTLRLYNTVGALLLTQEAKPASGTTTVTVPLPAAAGLYILQASQGERTTSTRLIKN